MLKSKVRENTSAVADLLNYLFLCSVLYKYEAVLNALSDATQLGGLPGRTLRRL